MYAQEGIGKKRERERERVMSANERPQISPTEGSADEPHGRERKDACVNEQRVTSRSGS